MGTDVFLLTKPAGSNSIQRACSQATVKLDKYVHFVSKSTHTNTEKKSWLLDYIDIEGARLARVQAKGRIPGPDAAGPD
jgi:hypothetical protein